MHCSIPHQWEHTQTDLDLACTHAAVETSLWPISHSGKKKEVKTISKSGDHVIILLLRRSA